MTSTRPTVPSPRLARDLMTLGLCSVPESMGLRELVDFLRENRIHAAAVAAGERLVGMVSYTDVLTWLSDQAVDGEHNFGRLFASDAELDRSDEAVELLSGATVRMVMTPSVFTCDAEASAGEVARLMLNKGIQRVIVTEQDKAVGVVSARDLLRALIAYEDALLG